MRKMTKVAVTLAAMTAMTVAAASMAFASEKQVANVTGGEWAQQNDGSWKYVTADDTKLKDTWAEIDGIWYYFDGEKMAQDSFLILDGDGYFFDDCGRLATGWQQITSKMDAYSDIDISEALYDPSTNSYTQVDDNHEYDYHDYVWCYFNANGTAKENEWFQSPETGLWYYFDGNVMVKNVYDYVVNPDNYDVVDSSKLKRYGFDENGAMLVGWNYKELDTTWNNPTADDKNKVWYYYKSNGEMQKAGWAEIGDKWYLFANLNADGNNNGNGVGKEDGRWKVGGYPLIVNSYVASYKNNSKSVEYFYVNSKGELASGVTNIKNAYKVVFYQEDKSIDVAYEKIQTETDKTIAINFSNKGYAAKEDIVDDRYYTMATDNIVKAEFGNGKTVEKVSNSVFDATAAFDDYSIKSVAWNFTDAGSAVVDTVSSVDYKDANDNVIKVPDTTEGNLAITNAKTAKTAKAAAEVAELNARTNWTANFEGETVAVTGYNATLNGDWVLSNLITATNNKKAAAELAKAAYEAAYEFDADSDITADAKATYEAASEEAALYNEALEEATTTAKVQAVIADNAVAYNAWETAVSKLENATAAYADAEKELRALNYEYFVNKWDNGVVSGETDFAVVGELVKNAFIGRKSDLYLADSDGDFVADKAVLINDNANITHNNTTYEKAYLVFGKDGKAVKGYEGKRKTITIGGVSYWSTDKTVTVGKASATVFVPTRK